MKGEGRGSAGLYVALTFGWTWAFWWSAVALDLSWESPTGTALFAVGGVGPVLAAAVLVQLGRHPDTPRQFWGRLVDVRRVPATWWLGVVALAVVPALAGRVASGGGGEWLQLGALTVLVTGLVAGLLEEPGWRGYAQDVLQRRHGPLAAALVVGVVWAMWHLPLFFFSGSYQHGIGAWTEGFARYLSAIVAWAVVYAWIYVRTGRSILAVVVVHALSNAAGELISREGSEGVEFAVVLLLAVLSGWSLARDRDPRAPAAGPGTRRGWLLPQRRSGG